MADFDRIDLSKYESIPGINWGTTWGGTPDPVPNEELRRLLDEERARRDVEATAAKIAAFHTALTDHGIDSFGAAMLTERFAVGAINLDAMARRWQ